MNWNNDLDFEKVDDLFIRLFGLCKKIKSVACRGQADSSWLLRASLDRILDANSDYSARRNEEQTLIEEFCVRSGEYLSESEEMYTRNYKKDGIAALPVLQHYRAPTRLLDWTWSPWVALYFAAIEHKDKDGAIWWFQHEEFHDNVHTRWKDKYQMKRYPPDQEVNLNDTAFDINGPLWITILACKIPFHRIEVQQGFFTVAGQLGAEHSELIADCLGEGQYGRIIVPASWKQEILNRLRTMNIHSKSLDYPGADIVGFDIRNKQG